MSERLSEERLKELEGQACKPSCLCLYDERPFDCDEVTGLTREIHALQADLAEVQNSLEVSAENYSKLVLDLAEARRDCIHPGCGCVCGHKGECPEDGRSLIQLDGEIRDGGG